MMRPEANLQPKHSPAGADCAMPNSAGQLCQVRHPDILSRLLGYCGPSRSSSHHARCPRDLALHRKICKRFEISGGMRAKTLQSLALRGRAVIESFPMIAWRSSKALLA